MYGLPSCVLLDTMNVNAFTKSKNYIFLTKPYLNKEEIQLHDETRIYTTKHISHITLNYKKNSIPLERFIFLNFNKSHTLFVNNNGALTSLTVKIFECETISGNIMILFKDSRNKNILYTGSFTKMYDNPILPNIKEFLNGERLHSLIFDDTLRKCSHPNSIYKTCSEISNLLTQYPKFTAIMVLPALDYEDILLELSVKYGIRIYINRNSLRYFVLKRSQLDKYFCPDQESAKIVVKTEYPLSIDAIESLFKYENKLTIKFVKLMNTSTYEKFKEYNKLGLFQFNYVPHPTDECRRHILDTFHPKFIDSMAFTYCLLEEENYENLPLNDNDIFKRPMNKIPKSIKTNNALCQSTNYNRTDDRNLQKELPHKRTVNGEIGEQEYRPEFKTANIGGPVKYSPDDISKLNKRSLKSRKKVVKFNLDNIKQLEQVQKKPHIGTSKYLTKNKFLDSAIDMLDSLESSELFKPAIKTRREIVALNSSNNEQLEREKEEQQPQLISAKMGIAKYLKKNNFLDSPVNTSELNEPAVKSKRKIVTVNPSNNEQLEREKEEQQPQLISAKMGMAKYLKKNNFLDSPVNTSELNEPAVKSKRKMVSVNSDKSEQREREKEEQQPQFISAKMGMAKYLKKNNFLDSPVNTSELNEPAVKSKRKIVSVNSDKSEQREREKEEQQPQFISAKMGRVKYLNKNNFLD